MPRIRRCLGWPQVSMRTLYRRVRLVAVWRRPKLTARGDPYHDHVVAGIVARLIELPRRAVVLAEDETHLNLLPHVRASWTLRTARPKVSTPGSNRQVTVFGAIEVTTGAWVYRLGRRCAADFIAKSSLPWACDGGDVPMIVDSASARASAADAVRRRRSSAAMPPPSSATTTASIMNSASEDDSKIPLRSRGSALV